MFFVTMLKIKGIKFLDYDKSFRTTKRQFTLVKYI
jgi:hypothetical protein